MAFFLSSCAAYQHAALVEAQTRSGLTGRRGNEFYGMRHEILDATLTTGRVLEKAFLGAFDVEQLYVAVGLRCDPNHISSKPAEFQTFPVVYYKEEKK